MSSPDDGTGCFKRPIILIVKQSQNVVSPHPEGAYVGDERIRAVRQIKFRRAER